MEYLSIHGPDEESSVIFAELMRGYIAEMNKHSHRPLPEKYWQKWIDEILRSQGANDHYLELCGMNGVWAGFLYARVDHDNQKGYCRPGWGYILEFYVKPEYRRKGVGREMFRRLEALYRCHGVIRMYLTADPVTGRPFWEALGFENTGDIHPDNRLFIYEKSVDAAEESMIY